MTVAALTWPEAFVYVAVIAAVGLIVAVLIWSIFRTGQISIRSDSRQTELVANLRREVDELRARLEPAISQPKRGKG